MRRWPAAAIVLALSLASLAAARAEPEDVAESEPASRGPTDADYARHVEALKERLPERGKDFTILVQRPFVVIGDESPAAVRRRAENTVRWAVERLKKAYFDRDPALILDVWLFKDETSYRKHARELFADEPSSPYGYYSPTDRALVMNIATGGGTLVHEIVHPFMAANFPACPTWFNEGLASLYEQSGDQDGEIVGYPNWRLPILQRAIRADTLPSFRDLCGTSTREFYRRDRGTNYAQARYLCYYLQEHGLLSEYYRAFMKNHEQDPTGYRTLATILEEEDMRDFQERWEAFVLALSFR